MNKSIFEWLLIDEKLIWKYIKIESYKSSGRGGQKVNKTSSAVRLTFVPLNISSTSNKYRKREENKISALRKLRKLIALQNQDEPNKIILSKIDSYLKNGLHINLKNYDLPILYSVILGLFYKYLNDQKNDIQNEKIRKKFILKNIAQVLNVTNTRLNKFISENKLLLENINGMV